jgi:signal peptidase I
MSTTPARLPIGRAVRRRWALPCLAVLVVAVAGVWLAVRTDVSYYRVTSGSMEPTLPIGVRVTADRGGPAPNVGDIVVFHAPGGADPAVPVCGSPSEGAGYPRACDVSVPQKSGFALIKRVVAGPGDSISIVDGHAVRNGVREAEPLAAPCDDPNRCTFPTPVRVPAGSYFVLGDNRGASDDSRFWGPVPSSWIIGTVVRCSWLRTSCRPLR